MRKKNFHYLWGILGMRGYRQTDLCKPTKLSKSAIEARFAGRVPWSLPDMYAVMDYLGVPHKDLHRVFPADISQTERSVFE